MNPQLRIAIIGLGYWGPNLLRNAFELEDVRVTWLCDLDPALLARQSRRYPGIPTTRDIEDILSDPDVDAVVLATPVSTHYELAAKCLRRGKHVLVEKPMAGSPEECRQLMALAEERELTLMPGHTFLYSPPVLAVREMLDSGEVGDVYFGTSTRVNLGIHQSNASVVRDLGPHDFSILLYWFGQPEYIRATGRDSVVPGTMDVAFVDVGYPNGALIHLELSWLAPTKLRRTVLVGSRKMVLYDDTSSEQVRLFDRGIDAVNPQSFGEFQLSYRSGDILTPRLDAAEPLRLELEDFVESARRRREPRSSSKVGLDVVRMIEATEASLLFHGAPVPLDTPARERRRPSECRRRFRTTANEQTRT